MTEFQACKERAGIQCAAEEAEFHGGLVLEIEGGVASRPSENIHPRFLPHPKRRLLLGAASLERLPGRPEYRAHALRCEVVRVARGGRPARHVADEGVVLR